MNKKVIIVSILLMIITAVAVVYLIKKPQAIEETHMHAAIQIYSEGELQDYSATKYMHISPCTEEDLIKDLFDVKERIHLHNGIGDVAHIHAKGVTWGEFLNSLEIQKLLESSEKKFYLNGEIAENLLDKEILEYESGIFVFGEEVTKELLDQNKLTKEYIQKAEEMIESC